MLGLLANHALQAQLSKAQVALNLDMVEAIASSALVDVTGGGFTGTAGVTITGTSTAGGTVSLSTKAVSGSFKVTLTIPINKRADVWTIVAQQTQLLQTLEASARLYAFAWRVNPSVGLPGASVTITGDHFPASRGLQFAFEPSSPSLLPSSLEIGRASCRERVYALV